MIENDIYLGLCGAGRSKTDRRRGLELLKFIGRAGLQDAEPIDTYRICGTRFSEHPGIGKEGLEPEWAKIGRRVGVVMPVLAPLGLSARSSWISVS